MFSVYYTWCIEFFLNLFWIQVIHLRSDVKKQLVDKLTSQLTKLKLFL